MSSSGSAAFVDYYEVLGIEPSAEIHAIRRAYILRAKEHHPDAGGSSEMMQLLNTAYRTLKDSAAKAAYDMMHNFHVGTTSIGDYRYSDGREVKEVTDLNDDEIDSFLDNLFTEYRNGPPKAKVGTREWLRNLFR